MIALKRHLFAACAPRAASTRPPRPVPPADEGRAAGFFATVLSMPRFGGTLADENGVPPLATVNLGGKPVALDTNLTIFCGLVAILIVAVLCIR